jgi:hypothetical protein
MIVDNLEIPFYKQHIKPLTSQRGKEHEVLFLENPDELDFEIKKNKKNKTIYTDGFIPENINNNFYVNSKTYKVAIQNGCTIVDINNFGSAEFNLDKLEVYNYILELCKNDISYPISLADLSSKIFRKRFLKYWITCLYPKESLQAFHGGKIQLYTDKKNYKKVYYSDIKSAYGSVIKNLPSFYESNLYIESKKINKLGIYNISCECKNYKYPYLFNENFKFENKLINQWVSGEELIKAKQLNLINNLIIHKGIYYDIKRDKNISPFKKFVNSLINKKNPVHKTINKLLINSLYGKFIQTKKNIYYDTNEKKTYFNFIAGGLFNPFIAGYITSKIRTQILNYEIEYNSVHTLIDAIISTKKPINENKIGGLINKISGTCEIKNIGVYLIKNKFNYKKGIMGLNSNPFEEQIK